MLAFVALVQSQVVVLAQPAQVGLRPRLPRLAVAFEKIIQFRRIAIGGIQCLVPSVGDRGEMAIECLSPCRKRRRQALREIEEVAAAQVARGQGHSADTFGMADTLA